MWRIRLAIGYVALGLVFACMAVAITFSAKTVILRRVVITRKRTIVGWRAVCIGVLMIVVAPAAIYVGAALCFYFLTRLE